MSRDSRQAFITIEAVGKFFAAGGGAYSDEMYRWCSGAAPPGDINGVYRENTLIKWPSSVEHSLELRPGSTASKCSVGGASFTLAGTSTVTDTLYWQNAPGYIAQLVDDLPQSGTSVSLDTSGLATNAILLEREVILLGDTETNPSAGVYQYNTSLRGLFDTTDTRHDSSSESDTNVFNPAYFTAPWHRVVTLGLVPKNADAYSDEVTIERYVLRDIARGPNGSIRLQCDSLMSFIASREIMEGQWTADIYNRIEPADDYPGMMWFKGKKQPDCGHHPAVDGGFRALMSLDKTAVECGWSGWLEDGNDSIVQLSEDTTTTLRGSPHFTVDEYLKSIKEIKEVFSTWPGAPELNDDASALKNRLAPHCVDRVRQILTTTRRTVVTDAGDNGDYDTGVERIGVSVPASYLDSASFADAKALIGAPGDHGSAHITEPVSAYDLCQQWLEPHNAALVPITGGKLGISVFNDVPLGGELSIVQNEVIEILFEARRITDPFDKASVEYDDRIGLGPRIDQFDNVVIMRRRLHGEGANARILAGFIQGNGDGENERLSSEIATATLEWWQIPYAEWGLRLVPTDAILAMAVGDKVKITHANLMGLGGASGVTDALTICTSMVRDVGGDPEDESFEVEARFIWVGLPLGDQLQLIAPSALVDSYASLGGGSYLIVIQANVFSSSTLPLQSDDSYRFEVGQEVTVWSRDRATERGAGTIFNITGLNISIDAAIAGTVNGDVLVLSDYDDSNAKTQSIFMADSGGTLGAASDAAHKWSG